MTDDELAKLLKQQLVSARAEINNLRARARMAVTALNELRNQPTDETGEKVKRVIRILRAMRADTSKPPVNE